MRNQGASFVGIGRYVSSWARTQPDAPALETAAGAVRTYAELDRRSSRLAHALLAQGCAPGDRVGIWLGNGLEYLDVYLACAKAGLVVVPVNARFTPAEADFVLGDSDARALVYCSEIAEQVAALHHRPLLVASDDLPGLAAQASASCGCARPRCSAATGAIRRRPRPRWSTAGSTPATSARSAAAR
ncbi:AMP-binding protein [Sporichthya sp.]|uniref:AMP-binding protein n=1 Tax=Sporichthya sp. TaxID=65475 RepID=UPI0018460547|nr:AMP-binding protein [Sporichthya sp.]MBA3743563.1 AMP-binding protein [Sporichthya sp.]